VKRTAAFHQSLQKRPHAPLDIANYLMLSVVTTRKHGGLFDVSHMGRSLINGEQAVEFLQYTLTNNAAALEAGQAQYTTIITNKNGGDIDDAYLYKINQTAGLIEKECFQTSRKKKEKNPYI